jgi:hypothetical protein
MLAMATKAGVEAKRAASIREEVEQSVAAWPQWAKEAGVGRAVARQLGQSLARVRTESRV